MGKENEPQLSCLEAIPKCLRNIVKPKTNNPNPHYSVKSSQN